MMKRIVEWPLASRDRIVHAFRPGGDSTAEGPFRTLRRHQWASAGVRVLYRVAAQLAACGKVERIDATRQHGNRHVCCGL